MHCDTGCHHQDCGCDNNMGVMPLEGEYEGAFCRQEFDCGAECEVVKHRHVVKHRKDIVKSICC